jgi:hypothetical protein
MGLIDWWDGRREDIKASTHHSECHDVGSYFDSAQYRELRRERSLQSLSSPASSEPKGGLIGAAVLFVIMGTQYAFCSFVLPAIESCDDRAAIATTKKESEQQAGAHLKNEPKYAKRIRRDLLATDDGRGAFKAKIGGADSIFSRSPRCGSGGSEFMCLIDEYPDFIVVRNFGDEIVIPKKSPVHNDAAPTPVPQPMMVPEQTKPAPAAEPSKIDIEMARKYREAAIRQQRLIRDALAKRQRLQKEIDAIRREHADRCAWPPEGRAGKRACKQLEAKHQKKFIEKYNLETMLKLR